MVELSFSPMCFVEYHTITLVKCCNVVSLLSLLYLPFLAWSLKNDSFSISHILQITTPVLRLWLSASSNTFAKPSCPSLQDSVDWTSFTSSLFCCWLTVTDVLLIIRSAILRKFFRSFCMFSCLTFWLSGLKKNNLTLDDACCLSMRSSSSKLVLLSRTISIRLLTSLNSLHMSHISSGKSSFLSLCHNLHFLALIRGSKAKALLSRLMVECEYPRR